MPTCNLAKIDHHKQHAMSGEDNIDMFEVTIDNQVKSLVQHVCYFEFFFEISPFQEGTLQVKVVALCCWTLVDTYKVLMMIFIYIQQNFTQQGASLEEQRQLKSRKHRLTEDLSGEINLIDQIV